MWLWLYHVIILVWLLLLHYCSSVLTPVSKLCQVNVGPFLFSNNNIALRTAKLDKLFKLLPLLMTFVNRLKPDQA